MIPKQDQLAILKANDDSTLWHSGNHRTHWFGMRRDITSSKMWRLPAKQQIWTQQALCRAPRVIKFSRCAQRFVWSPAEIKLWRPSYPHNRKSTWWVELVALKITPAQNCAHILLDEVVLSFGISSQLVCNNGSQLIFGRATKAYRLFRHWHSSSELH